MCVKQTACPVWVTVLQGWRKRGFEVLYQSFILLWPVEGKNDTGHWGQKKGKEEAEGIYVIFV